LHASPGEEVIADHLAHVVHYEAGAASALAGVGFHLIPGDRGTLTPEAVRAGIRPPVPHCPRTALVWVENTHNSAGGSVWPLDRLDAVAAATREAGLPLHLDGARLWNAAVASGETPARLAAGADTVSVCLSKGLGAPVGSLIVGPEELMKRAWVLRKQMGGGMRQSGLLAAGALHGLEHNFARLAEDHRLARRLAERLSPIPGVAIDLPATQTNIVVFDIAGTGHDALEVVAAAEVQGVRVIPFGGTRLRAVTHLDVKEAGIDRAAVVLGELLTAPSGAGVSP
jgi:threonine aldolase